MTTKAPSDPGPPASGGEAKTTGAAQRTAALRPRDAATLIIVDRSQSLARVLLGKRRMDMKFMPGKYVFPGGRVDKADRTVASADELAMHETSKLLYDMKGGPSQTRARALALAAVRETFEEAGIVLGRPVAGHTLPSDRSWRRFFDCGFAPALSPLSFFARAITPPGRPRRFDTRFFCVEASAISHRGEPVEDELSDLVWLTIEEARGLDLPPITRVILEDLGDRLKLGPLSVKGAPVPYYFNKSGTFKRQLIVSPDDHSSS
jgi:8-oxo-dGTP pyrophosphatase MutT (NUDIX family)